MNLRRLEHLLALVAGALREEFPQDYYKRCTYSTLAMVALLRQEGESAMGVGGNFAGFTLSLDGRRPILKGFATSGGEMSHFWIETADRLIDPSVHFLPDDATIPSMAMPAVAWPRNEKLPHYLRYKKVAQLAEITQMADGSVVAERGARFIQLCLDRAAEQAQPLKFPTWVATGRSSVAIAAKRGDPWARGAERFDGWVDPAKLPF